MAFLAFGLFLLLLGSVLTFTEFVQLGALASLLGTVGWLLVAFGAVLVVVHLAVGPRRARWIDERGVSK